MTVDPFTAEDKAVSSHKLELYLTERMEVDSFLEEAPLSEPLLKIFSQTRINLLFFIFIFGLVVLFFRIFWFQIWRGNYFYDLAEGNRIRIEHLQPERGLIFDRENKILAQNIPNFVLEVVPADLPRTVAEREKLLTEVLTKIPKERQNEFLNEFQSIPLYTYEPISLLSDLPYEEAIKLKIELRDSPGFYIDIQTKRLYPSDISLSHLLGYTGKISKEELKKNSVYLFNDEIGKIGLEFVYEGLLRGHYGQKQIEVDNLGKEERIISLRAAGPGKSLVLNIDLALQKKLAESLVKAVDFSLAKAGAAVAMDPKNGEILAMVSYPFFDNNLLSQGISRQDFERMVAHPARPFFNRAISGEYPSGSIIKPTIALGALEEQIITPKTTIVSAGGVSVGQWFFPDWKKGGHGPTDVVKALAESVNTFFYYLGGGYDSFKGLGPEKISQWLRLFGFGQTSGIDLSAEQKGLIPEPDWKMKIKNVPWYVGDTFHLTIGQGDILVTPLQVANFTSVLANNGKLFQPQILKAVLDEEGNTLTTIRPKIIREIFFSSENLQVIKKGLRMAVVSGTARALSDLPIEVAGKTGTAQATRGQPHAWFTCFAPYDEPELVLAVLVENGGQGSQVALPVAKEVLKWWAEEKLKIKNQK